MGTTRHFHVVFDVRVLYLNLSIVFQQEASSKGYYVKNKDGDDYNGWCWPGNEDVDNYVLGEICRVKYNFYVPGESSWIDFFNPEVRDWWASKFALDQYKGSTPTLSVWNDMNEVCVICLHSNIQKSLLVA